MFKPLGDILLNLLFSAIVPLVFFSIASTVAGMKDLKRLGKILFTMVLIFVATGLVASAIMIAAVIIYPPAAGISHGPAGICCRASHQGGRSDHTSLYSPRFCPDALQEQHDGADHFLHIGGACRLRPSVKKEKPLPIF